MQKISFGDKEYVKASEIAKRFKYTQDYVGQLCRGKKVDARLVGRTWYVVPESVTSYRKTKHQTQKTTQRATKQVRTRAVKKTVTVSPVIRGKTAKILHVSSSLNKNAKVTKKTVSATYSADETAHIPLVSSKEKVMPSSSVTKNPVVKIQKMAVPKQIKVVPHSKKKIVLKAEKIPEITLSAKLDVDDDFDQMVAKKNASVESVVAERKPTQEPKIKVIATKNSDTLPSHRARVVTPQPSSSKFHIVRDLTIVVLGVICAVSILAASSSMVAGVDQLSSIDFSFEQAVKVIIDFVQ